MADLKEIGKQAKAARYILAGLDTDTKNKALFTAAECLEADAADILAENAKDLEAGRSRSMPKGLLDRLSLTQKRISDMAEGLRQVAALPDPVGEILDTFTRHGLEPKRMKFVHPYADREANMVLIEAVRGGRSRMTVEKPLIVYQAPGVYMPEIYDIYGY